MEHTLNIPNFRAVFPAFSNVTLWPDAYITSGWDMATSFMSPWDDCLMKSDTRGKALDLLTAHVLQTLGSVPVATAGRTKAAGAVTSSTIDKVAVQRVAPPVKDGWRFWLSGTPYGVMLWALLKAASAGGFYAIGRPEQAAFRRGPSGRFLR